MRALPNILTGLRLVLALFVFVALAADAGAIPGWRPELDLGVILIRGALAAFIVAAVTDFFDGWLARRLGATSLWGAILDPIADKVLVCATLLGLLAGGGAPAGAAGGADPGARVRGERIARGRGRARAEAAGDLARQVEDDAATRRPRGADRALRLAGFRAAVHVDTRWAEASFALLWVAAAVTVVTGAQYFAQARTALRSS